MVSEDIMKWGRPVRPALFGRGGNMTKKPIYAEMQKANRRIKRLEKQLQEGKIIYETSTRRLLDTLKDKAAALTGDQSGTIRIGKLKDEDREEFMRILQRFNSSVIGTMSGQKKLIEENKRRFEETYGQTDENGNVIPISDEQYAALVKIFESDQFKKFKEKYGTYSGVVAEMAANPKTYNDAIKFLEDVMRDDEKYTHNDGSLDVAAYIDAWKGTTK